MCWLGLSWCMYTLQIITAHYMWLHILPYMYSLLCCSYVNDAVLFCLYCGWRRLGANVYNRLSWSLFVCFCVHGFLRNAYCALGRKQDAVPCFRKVCKVSLSHIFWFFFLRQLQLLDINLGFEGSSNSPELGGIVFRRATDFSEMHHLLEVLFSPEGPKKQHCYDYLSGFIHTVSTPCVTLCTY